jgi:hypothetical protein
MPRFPSADWIDAFCEHLEAHDGMGEVADALDGVYRFVIEPAGPVTQRHVYAVEVRPAAGGVTATRRAVDAAAPRLTLTADYERWSQLITGRLDIGMALMLRRLKVSGDLRALTRDIATAQPLMDALRAVETEWPDG